MAPQSGRHMCIPPKLSIAFCLPINGHIDYKKSVFDLLNKSTIASYRATAIGGVGDLEELQQL